MSLGDDLLILAVDESRGTIRMPVQLGFALAAAELVDLALVRRVEAVYGHIHVVESLRTGDLVLDNTLQWLSAEPKGPSIAQWITVHAADRALVHTAALLDSGELTGKLRSTQLNAPLQPFGLRVADPDLRAALTEKLLNVARYEVELEDDAFGALAHAADLPRHVLSGLTQHRTAKRLKELAGQFTDTWRYLPGCPSEMALGDADVAPGGTNPAYDEPWRLLIRLAVQEAVKLAEAVTRKSERENGLSKDVQPAANLAYVIEHRL